MGAPKQEGIGNEMGFYICRVCYDESLSWPSVRVCYDESQADGKAEMGGGMAGRQDDRTAQHLIKDKGLTEEGVQEKAGNTRRHGRGWQSRIPS